MDRAAGEDLHPVGYGQDEAGPLAAAVEGELRRSILGPRLAIGADDEDLARLRMGVTVGGAPLDAPLERGGVDVLGTREETHVSATSAAGVAARAEDEGGIEALHRDVERSGGSGPRRDLDEAARNDDGRARALAEDNASAIARDDITGGKPHARFAVAPHADLVAGVEEEARRRRQRGVLELLARAARFGDRHLDRTGRLEKHGLVTAVPPGGSSARQRDDWQRDGNDEEGGGDRDADLHGANLFQNTGETSNRRAACLRAGEKLREPRTPPYHHRVNRVFVALICAAVAVALLRDALPASVVDALFPTAGVEAGDAGAMKAVTRKILDSASDAAKLALGLVGVLALWMGVMRVAEKAGLIALLARALRPLLVRLFPEVPADHPAMGAIVMNMSANLLGLGNAATPLGLEAMKRLQELNPQKKSATNAMVLFLALNTTHITLIPARTIALRLENGSQMATNIVLPTILATACGTVVAFLAARLLERRYPVEPDEPSAAPAVEAAGAPSGNEPPAPATSGEKAP